MNFQNCRSFYTSVYLRTNVCFEHPKTMGPMFVCQKRAELHGGQIFKWPFLKIHQNIKKSFAILVQYSSFSEGGKLWKVR